MHPEFFKHVPDILQCPLLKHVLVILQCTLLKLDLLFAQADILPGYRQWPFSYDGRVKSLAKTPSWNFWWHTIFQNALAIKPTGGDDSPLVFTHRWAPTVTTPILDFCLWLSWGSNRKAIFLWNHYDDTQSPLLMIFLTFDGPLWRGQVGCTIPLLTASKIF